jgi:2-keto-4-pentenoate hydratase
MKADNDTISEVAEMLWKAQQDCTPCAAPTELHEDFGVEQAYEAQRLNIARRIEQGARQVGHKIGLTSHAIQEWLGVSEPDFGVLLDEMSVDDGARVDASGLLQPRAEAEIAFVLKRELAGPGVTPAQVIQATDFIVPAIEIIDSRVADWDIKYADTIADNASSGLFVLGNQPIELKDAGDLRLAGMALRKNGRLVSTGAGAACLGHPLHAVAWLANKLSEFDAALEPGQIILSGALGPVTDVKPGDWLDARVANLGSVRVSFK